MPSFDKNKCYKTIKNHFFNFKKQNSYMSKQMALPNILICIADEMRGDSISLGGMRNPVIKTPNLDELARNGVAFTNCFTVNPVCVPSRCCTFTGQYVHSNGHRSLYQLLEPHEENLFKLLKQNGYEVVWIGRNDLFNKDAVRESVSKRIIVNYGKMKINPHPNDHPLARSFYYGERSQEEAKDADVYLIKKALDYLNNDANKPFCLYLAFNFPHPPYTVEEPFFSLYDRDTIPTPIPIKLDDKPEFMRLIHQKYGLDKLNTQAFREIIATYYGMISRLDNLFGKVINNLKKLDLYDQTAILFFSDHGDYAGNYGLTEKWPNAFQDCLINVPLLMKVPDKHPESHIDDRLVETIDIFPTMLDIAKINTKYTHFGKNLLPLIEDRKIIHHDAVFAEGGYNVRENQCFEDPVKSPDLPHIGIYFEKTNIPIEHPFSVSRSAMIRTKTWKLIIRSFGLEELYDLKHDPNELNNLIDIEAYNKVKLDLKEKLLRWYLNTSDNPHWKKARYI
jgi:arylsulfatase A-like enzyme